MPSLFINRLLEALQLRKMTRSELAAQLGVRPSSVTDWLKGRYEPKRDKVAQIAKVLGVNPVWLLGAEYEPEEKAYYVDVDMARRAEALGNNSRISLLFENVIKLSPQDLDTVIHLVEYLKNRNQ